MAQYSSREVNGSYYPAGDNSENMKDEVRAKVPTYRHAQKIAMEHGDAGTYFMRKVGKKKRVGAAVVAKKKGKRVARKKD